MFRFSIRDVLVVDGSVAVGVAWCGGLRFHSWLHYPVLLTSTASLSLAAEFASSATVLGNGTVQVSWRMTQELYNDLFAALNGATPSNKSLADFFVSGTSNNGDYTI